MLFGGFRFNLVKTLNYSYDEGELSSSQKQAVISLIEKTVENKRYIKNWRPISLLNVDVKIASESLALRIKPVLKNDAYYFIKKYSIVARFISDISDF